MVFFFLFSPPSDLTLSVRRALPSPESLSSCNPSLEPCGYSGGGNAGCDPFDSFWAAGFRVPAYISAQVLGSTLASGTLRLIFNGNKDQFFGTLPGGSDWQSFVLEFIITFYLMFVISGVATDNRAIGELAGLAVGATVLLNVMFAGPISGASMNPARSLGPAIVSNHYRGIWIYMVAPPCGAIAGAWVYNIIRFTDKPLREITKSGSFLKGLGRTRSSS